MEGREQREVFYMQRKIATERIADANFEKAMQNEKFIKLYRDLHLILPYEMAKAEVEDDIKKLELLADEKNRVETELDSILQKMQLTRLDLIPKTICQKCRDTGYTQDGKFCDCYING